MRACVVVLVLVCSLWFSCKKKEELPQLPAVTKSGQNTMGCYVNGSLRVYSGQPTALTGGGVYFSYSGDPFYYASIGGGSTGSQEGNVHLYLYSSELKQDSVYRNLKGAQQVTNFIFDMTEYNVKSNDPFNYVAFSRIDNSVAAGMFQFRGYASNGDSVKVTLGQFDIAR